MIKIDSLVKRIKKKTAVDCISFEVKKGEVFALLGLNGAGKSTTIKTIMGFVRPTSGTVKLNSRNIGYLPENPYYYDYLTLKELLTFSLASSGIKDNIMERISSMAEKVGMTENLNKQLRTFSKGMVQRSGIAAALIHEPDLVIFDEPMSGLDPLGRRMVYELITKMKEKGATVLFCSHILSDAERLCDTAAIMNKGKIVRMLTKEELLLASKQAEVVFNKSEALRSSLTGLKTVEYENTVGVLTDSGEIVSFMESMKNKGFSAVTVKSADNALERIFEEAVR
ncbi:ABC transporter ATP-binding protein [Geovibrio ferrireducens]|uniref:ABC transporter ATP-binding protein n=1 Tax=Geovibrio ferrireducens TaxID=46201 RepID=UPI002246DE77|nr:ABC transporter ATP-binding protein [Geovibrio ferrireducens]